MASLLIKLLGAFLIVAGISIFIYPEMIFDWILSNLNQFWFYISVIVGRLSLGILLIIAAKESKYPIAIKVLGYLAVIAALGFLFIGHGNFENFLSTLITKAKPLTPISGVISLVAGVLLIYAFSSNTKNT